MRRAILTAIPVLVLTVILQTSIASRIMLLSGNADLVLLVVVAWGLQERAQGAWIWAVGASLSGWTGFGYPMVYLSDWISISGGIGAIIGTSHLAGPASGDVCRHTYRYIGVAYAHVHLPDTF